MALVSCQSLYRIVAFRNRRRYPRQKPFSFLYYRNGDGSKLPLFKQYAKAPLRGYGRTSAASHRPGLRHEGRHGRLCPCYWTLYRTASMAVTVAEEALDSTRVCTSASLASLMSISGWRPRRAGWRRQTSAFRPLTQRGASPPGGRGKPRKRRSPRPNLCTQAKFVRRCREPRDWSDGAR